MAIAPNARTRLAVTEVGSVTLDGNPAKATVAYASGAPSAEIEAVADTFALPLVCAPDLLTIAWEVAGIQVTSEVEIVAARLCTVDDVRAYRPDENPALPSIDDAEISAKIAKAESVIENEAKRHFQPVLVRGVTDRPNCRTTSLVFEGDMTSSDIRAVVSAKDQDGNAVTLARANNTCLDVRNLKPGKFAEVVVEVGMSPTPAEVKDAVCALAAWYLMPHAEPDNATSASTDLGFMRFVVGGVDGAATSIPEVNAVIDRYGMKDWKVG